MAGDADGSQGRDSSVFEKPCDLVAQGTGETGQRTKPEHNRFWKRGLKRRPKGPQTHPDIA